jgi:hypothetical protein
MRAVQIRSSTTVKRFATMRIVSALMPAVLAESTSCGTRFLAREESAVCWAPRSRGRAPM